MQNTANKEFINTTNSGKEAGFYITVDFVIKSLNLFVTMFGYPFGTLFLGIYLSIFVCNEYSSGYIKNIATLDEGRVGLVLAKSSSCMCNHYFDFGSHLWIRIFIRKYNY
ncbi:MAG: hypothetical protein V8R64_16910 [Thomasclavelia sp.]